MLRLLIIFLLIYFLGFDLIWCSIINSDPMATWLINLLGLAWRWLVVIVWVPFLLVQSL
jgi:hypothetical protein